MREFLCDRRPAGEDMFAIRKPVPDDMGASGDGYFSGVGNVGMDENSRLRRVDA